MLFSCVVLSHAVGFLHQPENGFGRKLCFFLPTRNLALAQFCLQQALKALFTVMSVPPLL